MRRMVEAVAPGRLGVNFRRLLGAFWTANLADGVMIAAAPLLVASLTRDPFWIAAAAAVQHAPWLVFGLYAGVIADRVDRRRLLVVTNLLRVGVLAVLAVGVATDSVGVGTVLAAFFVLGACECFNDTTTATLMPMIVAKRDLGIANARVMVGVMTINQLAGPPLGAALFVAGAMWPVVGQAVLLAFALLQLSKLRLPPIERSGEQRSWVREAAGGLRWLVRNPPVRTLALTILTFNLTFGATMSVLIVYASDRLDLGELGFGILIACAALGGIAGASAYGALERRFSLAAMMRLSLLYEAVLHGLLWWTTFPLVAGLLLIVFGFGATVWGTTSTAVRQRAVPMQMQGRVTSIYLLGVRAGLVVGALAGGALAQHGGVRLTLAVSCIASLAILALIWRLLPQIAHSDAEDAGSDTR